MVISCQALTAKQQLGFFAGRNGRAGRADRNIGQEGMAGTAGRDGGQERRAGKAGRKGR
jgi:hypothetical protein